MTSRESPAFAEPAAHCVLEDPRGRALRSARILFLSLAGGTLLFALIDERGGPAGVRPLLIRLLVGGTLVLAYGASYASPAVRSRIGRIAALVAYFVSVFSFALVHVERLSTDSILALLTIVVTAAMSFGDRRSLLLYSLFVVSGTAALGFAAGRRDVNPAVFLAATLSVTVVSLVSLGHRLRVNEELVDVNGRLKAEIAERLTAEVELRRAREAALEASRVKSAFLANMSHEIRTPMNGIIGMAELASDTETTPEQREYLDALRSSATSLLNLLNDILDLSKIEARKLELEAIPFRLRDGVRDTLRTLAPRAHQKDLELACRIPAELPDDVVGDPGRLRQILVNLVGNAIKFTDTGEVVVEVAEASRTGDTLRLRFVVRDTGIGIDPAKHAEIFEPFTQADGSTTRRYGGTGLGLTITSQLVTMMGGTIELESRPGSGSTFRFTVPFTLAPRAEETPDSGPANLAGLRVLVADDNETSRRILEDSLRSGGLEVVGVASGPEAISALGLALREERPFRLAVIDVEMPDMDGFSVVEALRADRELAPTPLVLLTSAGHRGDASRCRKLGVSGYLPKPVSGPDLLEAVCAVVVSAAGASSQPLVTRHSLRERRRSARVLLAEDNAVNRRVVSRLLEKRGHIVVEASDGLQAVDAFRQDGFDIVLMDVQMPGLDGLEATRRLRTSEAGTGRRTPVVALTAHARDDDRERCLEAGMDSYLVKPIDSSLLYEAVERAIPGSRATEPIAPTPEAVLDREAALRHVGGDPALLAEVARLFREDSPGMLQDIADALARREPETLTRTAHRLKGSLSVFGASTAIAAARRLEEAGRGGELADAHSTRAVLFAEVQRLVGELADLDKETVPS